MGNSIQRKLRGRGSNAGLKARQDNLRRSPDSFQLRLSQRFHLLGVEIFPGIRFEESNSLQHLPARCQHPTNSIGRNLLTSFVILTRLSVSPTLFFRCWKMILTSGLWIGKERRMTVNPTRADTPSYTSNHVMSDVRVGNREVIHI
jgi:hypothetical protein